MFHSEQSFKLLSNWTSNQTRSSVTSNGNLTAKVSYTEVNSI